MKNRRTSTLQVILDNMKQNLELIHYSESVKILRFIIEKIEMCSPVFKTVLKILLGSCISNIVEIISLEATI